MELSLKGATRCLAARKSGNALFGIVQGGMYPVLRKEYIEKLQNSASVRQCVSASATSQDRRTDEPTHRRTDFDGVAIGGLSVGEPNELMYEMVSVCTELLPKDKPRYLMGVGTPENI